LCRPTLIITDLIYNFLLFCIFIIALYTVPRQCTTCTLCILHYTPIIICTLCTHCATTVPCPHYNVVHCAPSVYHFTVPSLIITLYTLYPHYNFVPFKHYALIITLYTFFVHCAPSVYNPSSFTLYCALSLPSLAKPTCPKQLKWSRPLSQWRLIKERKFNKVEQIFRTRA